MGLYEKLTQVLMNLWEQRDTDTEVIKKRIKQYAGTGDPQKEFVEAEYNSWIGSEEYRQCLVAERYAENKTDILKRERYTFNGRGNKVKSKLSNTKRAYAFYRDVLTQRVRYLLARPFTVETQLEGGDGLSVALKPYITQAFRQKFKRLGKLAVQDGIAWLHPVYNEAGELQFQVLPKKYVIPFWQDEEHTILDAVIRWYTVEVYTGKIAPEAVIQEGKKKKKVLTDGDGKITITKLEFHTPDGVWFYQIGSSGGIEIDPDKNGIDETGKMVEKQQSPFTLSVPKVNADGEQEQDQAGNPIFEEVEATWGRVPFIAFKSSSDEVDLASQIKSLCDDYDTEASDLANLFKDQPESIKVVKDYDGMDHEDFLQKLADYRTAFVSGTGDVKVLADVIQAANVYVDLLELRKDIYHFGGAIDYRVTNFGNATGVGLRFLYGKLDSFSQDMADEFNASWEQLVWFIKQDIILHGGQDYSEVDSHLNFNVDQIINETETIANVNASLGVVSRKTAVGAHPWVENVDEEIAAVDEEDAQAQSKELARLEAQSKAYGFPAVNEEEEEGSSGNPADKAGTEEE